MNVHGGQMYRKLLDVEGQDGGWEGETKKKKEQGGHLRVLGNPDLF